MDNKQASPFPAALEYLNRVIQTRLSLYYGKKSKYRTLQDIPIPNYSGYEAPFTAFLEENSVDRREFIALMVALAPHLDPNFFDRAIQEAIPETGDFPQLGGIRGKNYRGFLPTGQTLMFLLDGGDLNQRFGLARLIEDDHVFAQKRVAWLEEPPLGEPALSGRWMMSEDYISLFTLGRFPRPKFSMNFPAQHIQTKMEWKDLVLNPQTQKQIKELEAWVNHGETWLQDWGMEKKYKPGYRTLFHGPPGTGKTFTASLLGKHTGKEVYKIDLSMVVSKFIGETEKNLARLFARAENKDWILFFDEADALFGKRTNVRDAHDKYANQEVAYLLQRVEGYNGLVILASNFKSNIDDAFIRRFQSIIHFPMPGPAERFELWKNAFPSQIQLGKTLDLKAISQKYEMSGASIMNCVQHCCIQLLAEDKRVVEQADLIKSIRRELIKEGKVI